MILLDTHVLVWLYQDPQGLLPTAVRERIDAEQVGLSPFVTLELQYLHEIGRLSVPASRIVDELAPKLELIVTDPPAAQVCLRALDLGWARDPFDRLLAAHTLIADATLVTKDRTIRANLPAAWWPA